MDNIWSLVIFSAIVVILVTIMLVLSYVLGERHKQRATNEPYESGILPTGAARLRLSVKYYLIAMFFVIFDLEAAFLYSWAVSFKELGWAGYIEVQIFILVLLVALIYLWRIGALDWGPKRIKTPGKLTRQTQQPKRKEALDHELVANKTNAADFFNNKSEQSGE
jgi:NADH-quinone oxidoreductase subunit A